MARKIEREIPFLFFCEIKACSYVVRVSITFGSVLEYHMLHVGLAMLS